MRDITLAYLGMLIRLVQFLLQVKTPPDLSLWVTSVKMSNASNTYEFPSIAGKLKSPATQLA